MDQSDVTYMRNKMTQHSEETNELFNLMARQIKKRCEERVNLYTVEDVNETKGTVPGPSASDNNLLMD